ncbi:MAG: BON domain-containing protein [Granulicella sp.]
MERRGSYERYPQIVMALAGVLLFGGHAMAQTTSPSTVPDAQIEANVLKALAGAPQLTNENIISNTVYGTVTLSGTVKDEPTRQMAESLASKAGGVQKVVDELTLVTESGGAIAQSDGTMPSSTSGQPQEHAPDPDTYAVQHDYGVPDAAGQSNPPNDSMNQGPTPSNQTYGPPNAGAPDQPGPGDQQAYPRRPYRGQRQNNPPPPPYGAQMEGQPVTVPPGALLRVRINEGLDSKHTQPGTPFDAIVLNDVVADGAVAIPRGAGVQGIVADAKSGGVIKGHGELQLQLTQVTLGGKIFPITSDVWSRDSSDKGSQTIGNAVGLGAFGAIIGAVAGGGPGAAIGAIAGGAAGVGTSAASGGRQVLIPSEAILTFHLAQPAPLTTISQAEMDRLSYGVPVGAQPRMQRRYPPRPYYGPVYYPQPY